MASDVIQISRAIENKMSESRVRSRSRPGRATDDADEPIIQERLFTNFEDVGTMSERERDSEPASVAWKGWAGARVKPVPCPLHEAHRRCLLRVTPRRSRLSPQESARELHRMKEELRLSNALGRLGVAPELEQGGVCLRSHQLAMVMEKYDLDLGKFIARNVSVSDEDWRSIAKLVINLLFKMARLGVFHGDIKPENIVLKVDTASGKIEARLIDFDPKYMSTFSKDVRLLEDDLDDNVPQLCALYAVSMMAILHYHFQERRTRQPELLQRMDDALRLFSLYLPTTMDISDSKFGRVLVRHLRHYRLMVPAHPARPASGDRDRMLTRFWEELETMGVDVQEKPSDVPTFQGKPTFFVASLNKIEKMPDVAPALSEEMKKDVHSLVLEEEAKHKKEMEKRKAARHQGF